MAIHNTHVNLFGISCWSTLSVTKNHKDQNVPNQVIQHREEFFTQKCSNQRHLSLDIRFWSCIQLLLRIQHDNDKLFRYRYFCNRHWRNSPLVHKDQVVCNQIHPLPNRWCNSIRNHQDDWRNRPSRDSCCPLFLCIHQYHGNCCQIFEIHPLQGIIDSKILSNNKLPFPHNHK